jgi:hypothetical protein
MHTDLFLNTCHFRKYGIAYLTRCSERLALKHLTAAEICNMCKFYFSKTCHMTLHRIEYCGVFMQTVAKQRLRKQISTEKLFSIRSMSRTLLCNAEIRSALRTLLRNAEVDKHISAATGRHATIRNA